MVPLKKDYLKQYLRAIAMLGILVIIPVCILILGLNIVHALMFGLNLAHEGHELLGGVSLAVFMVTTLRLGYQVMFMIDCKWEDNDA